MYNLRNFPNFTSQIFSSCHLQLHQNDTFSSVILRIKLSEFSRMVATKQYHILCEGKHRSPI